MRKFYFHYLYFYFAFFSFAYGQIDEEVSRYEKLISEAKHDTIKIRLNSDLANYYAKKNDSTAIQYQETAFNIAEKYGNNMLIANNLINLTEKFLRFGKFKEAIEVMEKASKFNKQYKNYHFQATIDIRRAWTSDAIREMDSTTFYADKAIQSNLKGKNDKTIEADAYIIKANNEAIENNELKATEYYLTALDISEKVNYVDGVSLSLVNLASRFVESGDLKKAENYTRKYIRFSEGNTLSQAYGNYLLSRIFFEQKQYDSTQLYSKKALDTYINLNRTVFLSELYMHLGISYNALKNYEKAINMYSQVIANDQTSNKYITFKAFLNLSEAYVNIGDVYIAKSYLDSASIYLEKEQYITDHFENINYLHYLINEKEGNFEKAHFYYKRYKNITDSIKNAESNLKISELESAHQIEKKEKEITSLNAKNKIKNLQLYLLIGISIIGSLLLFNVYYRFRSNKKIKDQLIETDKIKSDFFTNISHEFRTPLTLIQGSIEKEIEEVRNNNNLNVAYRNTTRLKQLVDQLLDISKIEAGSMKLLVEEVNLTQFLKVIYSFFSSEAKRKQINYINEIEEELYGFVDTVKLEKIIINLLSNAFKFTLEEGTIKINARINSNDLQVSVSDTGDGIVEKDLKKIFDRFYQSNKEITNITKGTGIGLALSNELAQIHKGSLTVKSKERVGSVFTLSIPIMKSAYNYSEINFNNTSNTISNKNVFSEIDTISSIKANDLESHLIIIAEDNADMQQYIYDILKEHYQVILVADGDEAFKLAEENVPTLIITDYMMPKMNGIVLCEKLKNNTATSHIPVIMLTARADETDKLKGLESGANIYLTKPFNKKELLLSVQNQISLVDRYKDWYENQNITLLDISFKSQPKEQVFINKIHSLLEEKFKDEGYGVHQFSEDLCLSRMQTYRKVKALTGKTPVDILKNFRLEKAKLYLENSSMDIGQISIASGFKNHSNFSKVFKESFGYTPVEYMEKVQNKS